MKYVITALALFLSLQTMAQTPEEQLAKKGIKLPAVGKPIANYVNTVRSGNLIFLAGKGPQDAKGEYTKGKLGSDLTVEQGYAAAELTAINQLAALKAELGDLSKVKRIVKVNGYVNSENNFYQQPSVINGFSDMMVYVFGEKGKHARTALGTNTLPLNMAVEIEMIVEVE